jgi:hypothetical protein
MIGANVAVVAGDAVAAMVPLNVRAQSAMLTAHLFARRAAWLLIRRGCRLDDNAERPVDAIPILCDKGIR